MGSKLKIKNVALLKDIELDVNRLVVLLGPQSSGKSSISKILCQCQWIEKNCFVDFDRTVARYQMERAFVTQLEEYHRMRGYFNADSYIRYEGDFIVLTLEHEKVSIVRKSENPGYVYPKLCYIPAERNLVAAIPNLKKYNDTNDVILYFLYDWYEAKSFTKDLTLDEMLERPVKYHYAEANESDFVYDGDSPALQLAHASSGIQSLVPLYMVIQYIVGGVYQKTKPLSAEQKLSAANRDFYYKGSRLYIEEPEQNLFPDAQRHFIYSFLKLLKEPTGKHTAMITTHSPFILFSLNNCLMGGLVEDKISAEERLKLPSRDAWILPKEVSVYEIQEGRLVNIQDEDGLLKENFLNESYSKMNDEFMTLLSCYGD